MEKKTKYIAGVSAIVASLIIGSVVYTESLNKLVLAKDTVTLELGEKLSTNPHDYLAKDVTDKVKELTINNSAILKDKEFTYDSKNQELVSKDKEFLNVGNYKLTFKYKDQTADVNVSVKDTKAPVVTQNKTEVSVVEGTKSIDYKSFFKTEDLDKTTLTIDDKEVNLSKAGTYKVKVTAEDASKNKTEKELKVIVTAKPKPKPKPVAKPKPKPSNPNNSNKKPSNGGSSTTKPSTPKPSNPKPKPSPALPKKYSDSTLKITITKEWYKNAYVYAAHVNLTDYSRFFTSNGNNKYGSKETTSHSAKRQGAILAINGSYSAPYLGYGVVRAGKVYNDKPANNMPEYGDEQQVSCLLLKEWDIMESN